MATFNTDLLNASKNLREYLNDFATREGYTATVTLDSIPIYNVGTVWTGTDYALSYTSTDSENDMSYILSVLDSQSLIVTLTAESSGE